MVMMPTWKGRGVTHRGRRGSGAEASRCEIFKEKGVVG